MTFKKGHIAWNKGKKHPIARLNPQVFKKGSTPWNKDKHWSKEMKNKLSNAHKGLNTGKKNYFWKGGIIKRKDYIYIWSPNHPYTNNDNYIAEHRLVMETHLGRYLKPEEKVHHLDGDVTNNKIENLYLFLNKSKHTTYHHFLKNCVRGILVWQKQ